MSHNNRSVHRPASCPYVPPRCGEAQATDEVGKKIEHLKEKIKELEPSKTRTSETYRGINKFKKSYQPRDNFLRTRRATLHIPAVF
jgi:hypothetical protein